MYGRALVVSGVRLLCSMVLGLLRFLALERDSVFPHACAVCGLEWRLLMEFLSLHVGG